MNGLMAGMQRLQKSDVHTGPERLGQHMTDLGPDIGDRRVAWPGRDKRYTLHNLMLPEYANQIRPIHTRHGDIQQHSDGRSICI